MYIIYIYIIYIVSKSRKLRFGRCSCRGQAYGGGTSPKCKIQTVKHGQIRLKFTVWLNQWWIWCCTCGVVWFQCDSMGNRESRESRVNWANLSILWSTAYSGLSEVSWGSIAPYRESTVVWCKSSCWLVPKDIVFAKQLCHGFRCQRIRQEPQAL